MSYLTHTTDPIEAHDRGIMFGMLASGVGMNLAVLRDPQEPDYNASRAKAAEIMRAFCNAYFQLSEENLRPKDEHENMLEQASDQLFGLDYVIDTAGIDAQVKKTDEINRMINDGIFMLERGEIDEAKHKDLLSFFTNAGEWGVGLVGLIKSHSI